MSVAAIVLVQGSGVAESAPNRDGSRSNANQDFIAQGVGNIASSLFRGQPVGGSVGQTALNIAAGARTRWASIFSGLWMLVILVAFGGVVGRVAMPTLAAVLIVAAIGSLRVRELQTVWLTGLSSQIALATTFLATLFLPVAAAVGIGVALSLLLQLNRGAMDLRVVELRKREDGRFEERPAPSEPAGSRRDRAGRVRQPPLRRGAHARGSAAEPRVGDDARRRPSSSRADDVRGDGARRPPRLRRSPRRTRRPALRERGGSEGLRPHPPHGRASEEHPFEIVEATPIVGESTDAAFDQATAWIAEARRGITRIG